MVMTKKVLLAVLGAAALVVAAAPSALAHAAYKDSDPADGATVPSPPSQITAEFTEPITDSSYLEVFDPCGNQVDNGDSSISGYDMSITLSADKAGKYVVEFAAQSVDTHVTYGSFDFTSSGGEACAGEAPVESQEPSGGGGGGAPKNGGGGGTTTDPGTPSGGGTGVASGGESRGGGGNAGSDAGGADPKSTRRSTGGRTKGGGSPGSGSRGDDPVPFTNAADRAPAEPNPWDLPVGGVVMALVLCVMIGAAGGRVYAGIVAPPRR